MNRDAVLRDTPEWRVLFLSDGEITLDDKIRESRSNKRRMAGQMVRVIDIEADAGKGLGIFDRVPEEMSGREFSDLLREKSASFYGTAAPTFLEQLTNDVEDVSKYLQDAVDAFVRKNASNSGAQAERVAKRFGLIAAAGELAINLGILPWPKGEASAAAKRCFHEWLAKHGTTGPFEVDQGIDQIRWVIERTASSRFEPWEKADAKYAVYDRLGYVKDVKDTGEGQLFYILPQGWKEICRGYNPERLSAELVKRGIMKPGSGNKTSRPEWLPGMSRGKKRRVYVLDASALFEDEADNSEPLETGNDLQNGVPGVPNVLHGAIH
jgi:putative DNA primase/helicase